MHLGEQSEIECIPILSRHFETDIFKTKGKYAVFDFYSDIANFELKSRRISSRDYPDTMVGLNKVMFARQSTKPFYFCFRFTDGLFYWQYDKEKESEVLRFADGGRTDRGKIEIKPYAFVKCSFLNKIPV